jgi:hypothetical protein
MPATTQINVAAFDELQNQMFDTSKKYLPLGVEILDNHIYGPQIRGLLDTISDEYNTENIFNLEVSEGFPIAVYGFTIALNKEGIPSLMFGNSDNKPNEFPIDVITDEDGDSSFNVRKAYIEFEQNPTTKIIDAYVGYKRVRVKARALLVENLNFVQLEKADNIDKLAGCLGTIPTGSGYAFKLKGLSSPQVIEQKGVKFPLMLNIDSIDEIYQGDSFVSRNLSISALDGSTVWGTNKDGEVQEVHKVSIYNSMTAGSICEEIGAARFLLCKIYGGTARLVIVAPNSNPDYNPKHLLQLLPPENPAIAEGYKKAKQELAKSVKACESYTHLLTAESVKKFTENSAQVAEVAEVPQLPVADKTSTEDVVEAIPF